MSQFTTTMLAFRAGTELLEMGCFDALILNNHRNKNKLSAAAILLLPNLIAITDTFLAAMRILGKPVNPRIELALIPIRLILCGLSTCIKAQITRNAGIIHGLVSLQYGLNFANSKTHFLDPRTSFELNSTLSVAEVGMRTLNVINLAKVVHKRFFSEEVSSAETDSDEELSREEPQKSDCTAIPVG